jgi:nucleolar protein 58
VLFIYCTSTRIELLISLGFRTNASETDFSTILPEDLEATVKAAAEISMGTEISDSDIGHIHQLCDQVIAITAYRTQLAEYLRNRMTAIAPNLTALVGELVGARLIAHAGSLLSLAKHPASTVQILGAEKALFRALKTKHDTPKYGLIYHASLIGQAPPKLKGKMARMVATKAALSIRVDALTDTDGKSEPDAPSIGLENRAKLESRLRALEHQGDLTGTRRFAGEGARKTARFEATGESKTYNAAADLVPAQREAPVEKAVKAVLDVKEEKRKAKEERRAKRKAEKSKSTGEDEEEEGKEGKMEVDGSDGETQQEKKRKRRESEANGDVEMKEVCEPNFLRMQQHLLIRVQSSLRKKPRQSGRPKRRPKRLKRRQQQQQQQPLPLMGRARRKRRRKRRHNLCCARSSLLYTFLFICLVL